MSFSPPPHVGARQDCAFHRLIRSPRSCRFVRSWLPLRSLICTCVDIAIYIILNFQLVKPVILGTVYL